MAGGIQQLSKTAQAGLKESLAAQSAPASPVTPPNPQDRKEPDEATFLDIQRVRRAADVAQQHFSTGDPNQPPDPRELVMGAISAAMTRMMSRIDLSDAVDALLERLFPLASPQLKQRLQAMFAPIPSPTPGPGAGVPVATPDQGAAGGVTGPPPSAGPAGAATGEAGPPA
jgi:hypothetical protein